MMGYEDFEPTEFTLDDKELLNEFYKVLDSMDDKAGFAKEFAFNLLKAKFLLDNYIVHHFLDNKELLGDNPWKLQYYYKESKNKICSIGVVNISAGFNNTASPSTRAGESSGDAADTARHAGVPLRDHPRRHEHDFTKRTNSLSKH